MIVAVCGGKGGVGKSTLAYELAGALDALAVDADLAVGDLPRGRGPDLHDVLAGRAAPREAVRGGPVSVLACGRSLAGARAADLGRLEDAVRRAAGDRDAVVDCPTGLRADTGVPLALADVCLLVASPRRWALADAVRTRAVARDLAAELVAVALARVGEDPPTAVVRATLAAPVTPVPETPALATTLDGESSRPVTERAPETDAAAAVRELATSLRACRPYYDGVE
ncbi:MinD/ParA family protein [Halobaculum sp. MBLA0143]|uniref:MinD/ParA family ATP-binding protein n=1 Tax=Halobaculum sp. MBLA0143 TaxID=3079933 RepID=UPI0035242831